MATVGIYFNSGPDHYLDGYRPEHPVRHVFTYQTEVIHAPQPEQLADDAFHMFNAPPELITDPAARDVVDHYRNARLRSLSIGDLVRVDADTWLACAHDGWDHIDAPTRILFDHTTCPPQAHDRDPGTSVQDGQPIDRQGLMFCRHCQEPLMFCRTLGDYDHYDPDVPPCFLVEG
jgi:hypothetical protein